MVWKIRQATVKGYAECEVGGVADLSYPTSKTRRGRVQMGGRIYPALTAMEGEFYQMNEELYQIRKLTPREYFRLMGFCPRNEDGSFDDECFEKAKWMHDTFYLKGGKKCSAKLKAAKEKPKHEDTETYVLCTTKDSTDMEILKTITSKSARMPESEKPVSVSIAIDRLEKLELLECATNIIRCIDYMETHFTLIRRKDAHLMDIIVQAKADSTNTGKCMKITTESNLDQNRLYTILTLSVLIIESRIFTATIQRANIRGCIMLIEDSSKNVLLKISNLKMECIRERVSNSELYKQAGNSIVVNCIEEILINLFKKGR